jgi:hypothetical protein
MAAEQQWGSTALQGVAAADFVQSPVRISSVCTLLKVCCALAAVSTSMAVSVHHY